MCIICDNKYFVSVIVPNYNHARYLDQRIQSILDQTYQNFELIILDDCSPDEGASKAVIEKYRNNPHVSQIVYNKTNSGSTFKQWDKGINLAKGDLIWIAESDDFCENNLLGLLVKEFERDEKLTLAYTLLQKVDEKGKPIPYLRYTPHGVTHLDGHDYVRRYMTTCNHCANASAALFKKSAYYNVDKQFTTYKAGGDMLFWIEIAELGNVAIINKRLNYFRMHDYRVTTEYAKYGMSRKEFKRTYDYLIEHFYIEKWRQQMIKDNVAFSLIKNNFSNKIKDELCVLWEIKEADVFVKMKIKTWKMMQNRLHLYL